MPQEQGEQTYSLREAAERIGRSPGWVRGKLRAGLIAPPLEQTKHGPAYRFRDQDVEEAIALIPLSRRRVTGGSADRGTQERTERQALALRDRNLELERKAGVLEVANVSLQHELERAREREAAAEGKADELQTRVEQLKAMGVLDRLRGRHKSV